MTAAVLGLLLPSGAGWANVPTFLNAWGSEGTGAGQFDAPFGIVVSSSGQVYVADEGNNRIQRFDATGNYLGQWGGFYSPYGVAVSNSGQVYVADSYNDRVQRFDATGNFLGQWGTHGSGTGQFDTPLAVAVSSSGYVYVADGGDNDRVQRFSATGTYLGQWGGTGMGAGQFNSPFGIATSDSGQVYVVDTANNRVQYFSSTGAYLGQWGGLGVGNGQLHNPYGIAVSSSGQVYVADYMNDRIQRFDAAGNYLGKWGVDGTGPGEFKGTGGVAVTNTGLVYVTDIYNYRVQRFLDYEAWVDPAWHTVPDSIAFDTDFSLNAGKVLDVADTTSITGGATLRLLGGGLRSDRVDLGSSSTLMYRGGVLEFRVLSGGSLILGDGAVGILPAGSTAAADEMTVADGATLVLGGGIVSSSGQSLIDPGGVAQVVTGTLGGSAGVTNWGELQLSDAVLARVSAPQFRNFGVFKGSGRVEAQLVNEASGEVRLAAGDRMNFTDVANTQNNGGRIEVLGNPNIGGVAEIQFAGEARDFPGGTITGRDAALRFNGGLSTSSGSSFSLTAGTNDVFGDIDNSGSIVVTGGAQATFYGDVEVYGSVTVSRVGLTNSVAVFLGDVTQYTGSSIGGGGDIFFEGRVSGPILGAGALVLENDVTFGPEASLAIELGDGEYSRLDVLHQLRLNGALDVRWADGAILPTATTEFDVLDWDSLSGTFSAVNTPVPPAGWSWDTSQLYTSGVLTFVAPALTGDYNGDGMVDAADYTVWRDNWSGPGEPAEDLAADGDGDGDVDEADYLVWKSHFGQTAASGTMTHKNAAVPEPAAWVLFVVAVLVAWTLALARRRGVGRPGRA